MEKYHPGLLTDYISVSSVENKVRLLETYEYAGNPKDTMLMIDDRFEVVHSCRHAGFDVQEPQYIMNLMFKNKLKGIKPTGEGSLGNEDQDAYKPKMASTWNTPDVLPPIDDSLATTFGYTSLDLQIIYEEDGEERLGLGWYSEKGNWYLQGKEEPNPVKIILWAECPNDIWRKAKGWPV